MNSKSYASHLQIQGERENGQGMQKGLTTQGNKAEHDMHGNVESQGSVANGLQGGRCDNKDKLDVQQHMMMENTNETDDADDADAGDIEVQMQAAADESQTSEHREDDVIDNAGAEERSIIVNGVTIPYQGERDDNGNEHEHIIIEFVEEPEQEGRQTQLVTPAVLEQIEDNEGQDAPRTPENQGIPLYQHIPYNPHEPDPNNQLPESDQIVLDEFKLPHIERTRSPKEQ